MAAVEGEGDGQLPAYLALVSMQNGFNSLEEHVNKGGGRNVEPRSDRDLCRCD